MSTPTVAMAMGSKSDLPKMQKAANELTKLGIPFEMRVLSAHRTPAEAMAWASGAADRGVKVLICGAGMAAHLAGVVAAHSQLPVIGVPMNASLGGMDSLLATVQMPPGVPVATVGIDGAGAKNAAWLAARIIALSDAEVAATLAREIEAMRVKVLQDDQSIQQS